MNLFIKNFIKNTKIAHITNLAKKKKKTKEKEKQKEQNSSRCYMYILKL